MSEIEFTTRMGPSDALMWAIEKDPLLRSTITSVFVFDTALDQDSLLHTMERATRVIPRLRQRVRSNPMSVAPPRWEIDPNFNLSYHLRFGRVGGEGTLRDLMDAAQPVAMQGFDRARPLWEMVVLDGMENDGGGVILKIHHSISDGVGAVAMMMEMFDLERSGTDRAMPPEPQPQVMGQTSRFVDAAIHETRRQIRIGRSVVGNTILAAADPIGTVSRTAKTARSAGRILAPTTDSLSPVMKDRSLSVHFDSIDIPLADLKAAAASAGSKLNGAFVAGVLGGFQRYHAELGAEATELRMAMPINVRTEESSGTAGNQFVPARITLDATETDASKMIKAISDQVAETRAEPGLRISDPLSDVLTRLPTTTTTAMFGSMLKGVDFTTSNVPGAPITVFLAGAELQQQYALGPMSGAGANVTLLSYLDMVHLGVNVDTAAVTDPDLLMECLRKSYDDILALAP